MNAGRILNMRLSAVVPTLLGMLLVTSSASSDPADGAAASQKPSRAGAPKWTKVTVELPVSQTQFPPGKGADLSGLCLICHSAGMVLRQPPLTLDEWVGEINKMRNAFGAPIPADRVQALAEYLYGINGRSPSNIPSTVDKQDGG
jgi:ABC-type transport system substrate-binding protein